MDPDADTDLNADPDSKTDFFVGSIGTRDWKIAGLDRDWIETRDWTGTRDWRDWTRTGLDRQKLCFFCDF